MANKDNNSIAEAPQKNETTSEVMDRRTLLEHLVVIGAGVLSAVVGAGEVNRATADSLKQKHKYRYGMVIDTKRCVGCKACVLACKAENKTPPGVYYNVVVEDSFGAEANDRPLFLTKPCFHCENPPCVPVCPVSATFKRKQDGIVVIDYDRCIGCRYCITACPYGARTFDFGENYAPVAERTPYAKVPSPEYKQYRERNEKKSPVGNVRKCTFCVHLQDEDGRYNKHAGRWPACAKTCTGHAIFFGDLNDPDSEVSRILRERKAIRMKEELGTEPNVYYLL